MRFIALHSEQLDMQDVSDCIEEKEVFEISYSEEDLLESIKKSILTSNYYKVLFIYPSNNSKSAFELIRKVREAENDLESRLHIIVFSNSEKGVYFLNKLALTNETFVYKKIGKRRILEIIESLG